MKAVAKWFGALVALAVVMFVTPVFAAPLGAGSGDANQDGAVTVTDAIYILQDVAGTFPLSPAGTLAADIDGDGMVTITDTMTILNMVLGVVPPSKYIPVEHVKVSDVRATSRIWRVGHMATGEYNYDLQLENVSGRPIRHKAVADIFISNHTVKDAVVGFFVDGNQYTRPAGAKWYEMPWYNAMTIGTEKVRQPSDTDLNENTDLDWRIVLGPKQAPQLDAAVLAVVQFVHPNMNQWVDTIVDSFATNRGTAPLRQIGSSMRIGYDLVTTKDVTATFTAPVPPATVGTYAITDLPVSLIVAHPGLTEAARFNPPELGTTFLYVQMDDNHEVAPQPLGLTTLQSYNRVLNPGEYATFRGVVTLNLPARPAGTKVHARLVAHVPTFDYVGTSSSSDSYVDLFITYQ